MKSLFAFVARVDWRPSIVGVLLLTVAFLPVRASADQGSGAVLIHSEAGTLGHAWLVHPDGSLRLDIVAEEQPGDFIRLNPDGTIWTHSEYREARLTVQVPDGKGGWADVAAGTGLVIFNSEMYRDAQSGQLLTTFQRDNFRALGRVVRLDDGSAWTLDLQVVIRAGAFKRFRVELLPVE